MIIAHHIILTGYGHWLPNDPRGSLSQELRELNLSSLGEIHFGRKYPQPTAQQLRQFYQVGKSQLRYPILWFDPPDLPAIAETFAAVIAREKLTCYACAILRNHAHLLIRRHRLKYEEITHRLKVASADTL